MRPVERYGAAALGLAVLIGCGLWSRGFLGSEGLYRYGFEWLLKLSPGEAWFYAGYAAAAAVGATLLAWALVPGFRRALPPTPPEWLGSRAWLPAFACLGSLAAAGLGFGLLGDQVVTDDEYVYVFQARLMLLGEASIPPPSMPEFFGNAFVDTRGGRWFGQYPPGHPLLLAPAVWAGIPRLTPVLLAGFNILLTGLIARRLAGRVAGNLAAFALLTSPLFLLTGATLLSHGTAYFGLALAVWGALRASEPGDPWGGLIAGAGLGLAVLARPWTGVTLGVFPAWLLIREWRRGRRAVVLPAALILAACGAGFLAYNRLQTGDAFLTGYEAQRRGGGMIEFGFGTILPGIHTHDPVRGAGNVLTLAIRFALWAWPLSLLPLVAWGRVPGRKRRAPRGLESGENSRWARGCAVMILAGLVSYIPYWSVGVNDTGPVKTYELLLPLAILVGLGAGRWAARSGPAAPAAWVAASLLAAGFAFWPVQLGHLDRVREAVSAPLEAAARAEKPAVVFMGNTPPALARSWVFGRPNPHPDLSDAILFVADLGPANAAFARLHPDRKAYVLERRREGARLVPLLPQ